MKHYSLNKSAIAGKIFAASKISTANDKNLKFEKFSDGEILPTFLESVRGEEIFITCDGNTPDDVMKLFLASDAAKRSGVKRINVILPYKQMPLERELFEDLARRVGIRKILVTKLGATIESFHTVNLGEKTEDYFAEYVNSFDKNMDKKGELFYSLNKSPLAHNIFAALPYYNGTDEYLTIDRTMEATYVANFANNLKNKNVFIIADGHHAEDIMKLLATINVAKLSGAKKVIVVYPYAPYSRQDKNDHVRSSIGAKMLADILQEAGMTQMITIELHAGSIQGFYDIPIIHLNGNLVTTDYMRSLEIQDLTFTAPDHGAVKRNKYYAKAFPGAASDAVIDKGRKKPNEVDSMTLIGEVKGRNAAMVDDMGDTMGTLCKASTLLFENGALTTRGILTHPVLSGKALENIAGSSLTELIVSDTIATVYEKVRVYNETLNKEGDKCKITIRSCAPVLAGAIDRLIKKESIDALNTAEVLA